MVVSPVSDSREGTQILGAAAAAALLVGGLLLLASWDGLYRTLDLPQPAPSLAAQLGGAAFVALAYLLARAATRPELAGVAAGAGTIAHGGAALVIAGWLIFRDTELELYTDTLGTVILIVTAAVLALLALAQARLALTSR
jgi:hypothetical protein